MMLDYSVYLVTDRGLSRGRTTFEIVKAAIRGGVSCVQLREKSCSTLEFIKEALSIRSLLSDHGVPLIINDRVDVALAVEADGVHLGQSDMPCRMVRQLVPENMIVGISAESLDDAIRARQEGADYLGVSPIYATPTKTDTAEPLGIKGLKAIRSAVDLPLVGIGGLNAGNAGAVIHSGADGVAVVSAIVGADDPEAAARELAFIVKTAKSK